MNQQNEPAVPEANGDMNGYVAQLKSSLTQTIEAMALATEVRDPYTAGHQKRVADLARAIGERMGLEASRLDGLHIGALIHDVGKLYVPSEILSRPGTLNEVEYELIKTHAEMGYEICRDIDFPWPVAEMVLQHHERVDGSGYPRGLKGEAIMLEARIIAVADTVESTASHRPYRTGLGVEHALEVIRAARGIALDRDVVDACIALFETEDYLLAS